MAYLQAHSSYTQVTTETIEDLTPKPMRLLLMDCLGDPTWIVTKKIEPATASTFTK